MQSHSVQLYFAVRVPWVPEGFFFVAKLRLRSSLARILISASPLTIAASLRKKTLGTNGTR